MRNLFKKAVIFILTLESRLILKKYKPFIVAVTGSVGKTSTKDAIFEVFRSPALCTDDSLCHVRKSEKSLNSEIGLPLTIIGVPNAWRSLSGWLRNVWTGAGLILKKQDYPDCLILEVGADHPNDIRKVVSWLQPDISVITRVSKTPVHVEFFNSPEQVFEEKASLAEGVKKSGAVILFADDDKVMSIAERVKDKEARIISFGLSLQALVHGSHPKTVYDATKAPIGVSFTLEMDGDKVPVTIKNVAGRVYLYPLLAAAAAGKARHMEPEIIAQSLNKYEAPHGRMNLIKGMKGSTIIDDTYNSSPDAALAALDALKEIEYATTKIAVLGDMMELGKYAGEEHRRIGTEAARILGPAGRLITVGQRSRATAEEAIKSGMPQTSVIAFDSSSDAAEHLPAIIQPGDIVLVKGSQSVRMERVVKALMADPSTAPELLVRQEKEWLER